jgi:predicted ATPase
MENKMILTIDNVGPINKARIDIRKINVITGENGSGKTTSSKLIYFLLVPMSFDGVILLSQNIKDRFEKVLLLLFQQVEDGDQNIILNYHAKINNRFDNLIELQNIFQQFKKHMKKYLNNEKILTTINEIDRIFQFSEERGEVNIKTLQNLIKKELSIDNLDQNSKVCLYGTKNNQEFEQTIIKDGNSVKTTYHKGSFTHLHFNDIVYIESPYILDIGDKLSRRLFSEKFIYHQDFLIEKLKDKSVQKDIFDKDLNKKTDNILKEIQKITGGTLYFNQKDEEFKFKKDNREFNMNDTANGYKQLGILQLLLQNRKLTENSYLIMDEPEAHLHPEWQLKLIKILYLLVKELNINLYINSHSPHFVEGLEVYAKQYNLENDISFYSSHYIKELDKYDLKNIPLEELHKIYKSLGTPYEEINKIRAENITKDLLT